jgi:PAS domain S-box-containing protein
MSQCPPQPVTPFKSLSRYAETSPLRGARILVASGRRTISRVAERTLRPHSDFVLVEDDEIAHKTASQAEFDLFLLDIEGPGRAKLTLAEELSVAHPRTALILITGEDGPSPPALAFAPGAPDYLVAPFSPGQLVMTAEGALRRRVRESAIRDYREMLDGRLLGLVDRVPLAVGLVDVEGRILFANPAAHEMIGLTEEAMIGRSVIEMRPEVERDVAERDLSLLATGGALERDFQVGGRVRTIHAVGTPVFDRDGRVAGVYAIATDVTDRKQAEQLRQELVSSQRRLINELTASRHETVERLLRAIEHHDADTG